MSKQVVRFGSKWSCCLVLAGAVAGASLVASQARLAALGTSSYHLVENWPEMLPTVPMAFVSWVDVDPKGQTYVFRRCSVMCSDNPHPGGSDPPGSVLLFDSNGKYLREWEPKSGGKSKEAHALRLDRHGAIWTTDVQTHVVKKYGPDGTLLMTLGTFNVPGETPTTFNKPSNVFVAADDSIYVTDGYGNQRVVKFSKDGKYIKAWGKLGTGPGEFRLPHGIVQDRSGRIIVADRCGLGGTKCVDGRVQIFDTDGKYLTEWTPPGRAFAPFAVAVDAADHLYIDDTQNNKVWILEAKSGKVLETIDGVSGHGMAVSSNGDDVYVTGSKAGVIRYSRSRHN